MEEEERGVGQGKNRQGTHLLTQQLLFASQGYRHMSFSKMQIQIIGLCVWGSGWVCEVNQSL